MWILPVRRAHKNTWLALSNIHSSIEYKVLFFRYKAKRASYHDVINVIAFYQIEKKKSLFVEALQFGGHLHAAHRNNHRWEVSFL